MCSIPVFGVEGETLAPCHPARARQLLKKKRAVVKSIQPYSIRLLSRSADGSSKHSTLRTGPEPSSRVIAGADNSNSAVPANPFHGNAGNRQTVEVSR
ncbi:MAG: RRXRR domain-containing protein [Candidatus Methylumidiphilus sp.]